MGDCINVRALQSNYACEVASDFIGQFRNFSIIERERFPSIPSFLDILDALNDGPLQPLGLLGVEVQEVTEGGRVPEPYLQFGVPLFERRVPWFSFCIYIELY